MFLGTGGAGRGVPTRRAGTSPVGRPLAPSRGPRRARLRGGVVATGGETRR